MGAKRVIAGKLLVPGFIGILSFISIAGIKILDPSYIDWLMFGDPAGGYLGWEYYRQSPLLQWPIGDNSRYGMVMGSSIVLTDSIPLFALLFKPFSQFLPDVFQYHGIWILCCFVLQSILAWKLINLFTDNKATLIVGCFFFLMAPSFLWRLFGHYSLLAHWLILWGIYLYFVRTFSSYRWLILIGCALLVHAYFVIMIVALWGTDLLQRTIKKEISFGFLCKHVALVSLSALIIMWASGYFMIGTGTNIGGYGDYFRLNLLALIDPGTTLPNLALRFLDPGPVSTSSTDWSRLLPDLPSSEGDYEGFSFLGLGVLGLVPFVLYLLSKFKGLSLGNLQFKTISPLLTCSLGILLYALSNQIVVGEYELISYSLPKLLQHIADTFRAPGRMFWVVYYLIYVGVFYVIGRYSKSKVAPVVCSLLLCIQFYDSFDRLNSFRSKFVEQVSWETQLTSEIWTTFGTRYKNIVFVLPKNHPQGWISMSKFAVENEMTINAGLVAHYDSERLTKYWDRLKTKVIADELDSESLYIFLDNELWRVAQGNGRSVDFVKELDGYRVLAPRFYQSI